MRILSIVMIILLGANGLSALAESQRTLLYDYDEAGNLIAVDVFEIGGAPIVDSIQPQFLRRNSLTRFNVSGSNLNQVQISATAPELQFSNINYISDTEVEFDLFTFNSPLGSTDITFSNLLGSTIQFITIAERLRIIATNPSPLLLVPGEVKSVSIRIDEPFDSDKQFRVAISDSSVASITSPALFVLPAGQSEVELLIEGIAIGNTQLTITQIDDSLTNNVAVSVLEPVTLGEGTQLVQARVVGVRLQRFTGTEAQIYTQPVGVSRRVLVRAGESIESAPVGVELLTE